MRRTKRVRKPRDSERALYAEGSFGNASKRAMPGTASSNMSSRDLSMVDAGVNVQDGAWATCHLDRETPETHRHLLAIILTFLPCHLHVVAPHRPRTKAARSGGG